MNSDPIANQRVSERESCLSDVIETVVRRRVVGDRTSDDSIIAEHPELMPELADALQALQFVEEARSEARSRDGLAEGTANHIEATEGSPLPLPPDSFPGYTLEGEFHRGGQGVVYRAIQAATGRTVAIKVMHGEAVLGAHGQARFEREARILARLKHPNIVTIHDGGSKDGNRFLVMDWIAGQHLDVYMSSRQVPIEATLRLFGKICEAVNAAHLRGIIHRDLKPSNILVDENGEPQVLDFGLAKSDADENSDSALWRSMTVTGQFVGSLPWSSPEQADGRPEEIDLRTDVYSLGVVLYQALTGRFPYAVTGSMRDTLRNIVDADPLRPGAIRGDINNEVETIVLKCLSKAPSRRYQTAGELAADIDRYLCGEPIEAKRDSVWYVLKKTLRRYRVAVAVVAAIVLLLGGSTIALSIMYKNQGLARIAADKARMGEETQRKLAQQREVQAVAAREAERAQRLVANRQYEELVRLADLKRLADARSEAETLWPAHPEKIEDLKTWLETRAAPLRENLPKHEATLQSLREETLDYDGKQRNREGELHPRAVGLAKELRPFSDLRQEFAGSNAANAEATIGKIMDGGRVVADSVRSIEDLEETNEDRRNWKFVDAETQWQHDTLAELVRELRKFLNPDPHKGIVASVEQRLEFAGSIQKRSITGPEAATRWAEAIADIALLDVYGGLQLAPQLGLLPLRRNIRSGLWEFWHIQTGGEPRASADSAATSPWVLTGDTGLTFVLIPGGTFWMGAQKNDPEARNYAPQTEENESPVHQVTLDAFFVSKYEMTQGQWERFTGTNPSNFGPDWNWKGEPPTDTVIHQNQPWNPVEQGSWQEARKVLDKLGLEFPTEAQWEYAARAGTNCAWWTGNEPKSIGVQKAGNLADGWTKRNGGPRSWQYEDWLEDGWGVHAPVGSFRPNRFGLHDVIGNVWEWCRDGYGGYDRDAEDGDGFRNVIGASLHVFRGGSFSLTAGFARSAFRGSFTPGGRDLGIRPARCVEQ